MKILAFDTSTKFLTISCLEDREVKASFHRDVGIRHSEILVSTIKDLLEGIGWDIKDIELICVGLGPGSFTGLRIAVATVKAFAAILDVKVVGVPTMDAIVFNSPGGADFSAPLLDARKEKVYTCVYETGGDSAKRISEYLLVELDTFLKELDKKVLFFGDGVEKYRLKLDKCKTAEYDDNVDWYPRADNIGRLGYERLQDGAIDPEELEPLYLHSKECNITQKKTG